jgi:hypothetical protein
LSAKRLIAIDRIKEFFTVIKMAPRFFATFTILLLVVGCKTMPDGYHKRHWISSSAQYTGMYLNGYPHGKGTLVFDDGQSKYVGNFRKGKLDGHGKASHIAPHVNAGYRYVGEHKDGKRHGHGTRTFSAPHKDAGGKYVGEFNMGEYTEGTLTFSSPHDQAGLKYVGLFSNNLPNGKGTMTFSAPHKNAGKKYVGQFKDGNYLGQSN